MEEKGVRLIVGLGNPGAEYEGTRHNVGFFIVREFAKKNHVVFRQTPSMSGEMAQCRVQEKKVLLLLPMTYMNKSGESVKRCMSYFNVPLEHILVIADDVAIPFKHLRMRAEGGSGGHKGLKSIETHLGTQKYARLKVGVGDRESGSLEDYVLGRFTQDERGSLPRIAERAQQALDLWISEGIAAAMRLANAKDEEILGE